MPTTYISHYELREDLCRFIDAFKSAKQHTERLDSMKFNATDDTSITIKGFYEYNNYIIAVVTRGQKFLYSTKDFTSEGYCSVAEEIFQDVYENNIEAPFIQWKNVDGVHFGYNDNIDVTLKETNNYGDPAISVLVKLSGMDGNVVVDDFWNGNIDQAKERVFILCRNIIKEGQ